MPIETFTKLESRIIGSTIWAEDDHTRILWITMLALADRTGYVGASIPGLAVFARIPVESVERAIEKFLSPDKYSRSQENEGRRIEIVDRGWMLINYARIRGFRDDDDRRYYEATRKKEYRDRLKVHDQDAAPQQIPVEAAIEPPKPTKKKRATHVDPEWRPDETLYAEMMAECPGVDLEKTIRVFRDYWIGEGKPKADWSATFRNWVRKDAERGNNGNGRGRGKAVAVYTEPPRVGVSVDDIRELDRDLRHTWARTDATKKQATAYTVYIRANFAESLDSAPTLAEWIAAPR